MHKIFIHDNLSALERTKTFNNNIIAYLKGKNASNPLIIIIALLKESFACGELVSFISKDKEKYFNRVTHAIQVLTMLKVGIPLEGYIDMKEEDMTNQMCKVIISLGKITIHYKVGLPQRQTPSVLNCELVSKIKIG